MSRHRNVRSMNYEDEYYDDDDDYSRSFEDNYCISPGTVAQFTWNRERNTNLASYMGAGEVIDEVEVEEDKDDEDSSLQDSLNASQVRSSLNETDQALLNSCLEEIHNIMGETVPESIMIDAILRNKFSVEKSLNELLSPQDAPKPQRQPRIRNKSQDDSDDTIELNKLLTDIQSLESITKPEDHAPTLLRFKSNPGSDDISSGFEFEYFSKSPTGFDAKDGTFLSKSEEKGSVTRISLGPDVSVGSLSELLKKERKEQLSSKPKLSLVELAKQSNSSRNLKEPQNGSKLGAKILSNDHSLSDIGKSGKVSLADLAKQSSNKTGSSTSKLNKESNLDSSILHLGKKLNESLTVQSSQNATLGSGKLSLADLAKQHKSNTGEVVGNKMKLGDTSSAFVAQHLAQKRENIKQNQNTNVSQPLVSTQLESDSHGGVVKTPLSHTSLSELANRHKSNLQNSHASLKADSKLGALSALAESHKLSSGSQAQSMASARAIPDTKSAETSLAKLSLTSCLKRSKQNSSSLVSGRVVTSPDYHGDFGHIVSADNVKENKEFSPENVIAKVDMSLISVPSSSAVVLSDIICFKQNSCSSVARGKRKMSYPSFACHSQVKKRRLLYPQPKLHPISAFSFSTMSPDDIVKKKQKQAFMRSEKEFNFGNSSHS